LRAGPGLSEGIDQGVGEGLNRITD
jgi:hypothetical protein